MSNNNSAFERISNRINLGSTGSIFILFTLIFLAVSLLFYFLLDGNRQSQSKRLVELTVYQSKISETLNGLEDEAQKSLKYSLFFNISKKEIDRLQTVYSLKSTKELAEEFTDLAAPYREETMIGEGLNTLNQLLTQYDENISNSINNEGSPIEIINEIPQNTDSLAEDFLFEEAIQKDEVAQIPDTKIVEGLFEQIQIKLSELENQFKILTNKKIDVISKESPLSIYVTFSLVSIALLVILAFLIIKKLKSSVGELSDLLDNISKGELPEKGVGQKGEFAKISTVGNQLINYLDDAGQFAVKIGDGDFDYEFKPKSKQDALGNSLIDMRNRLQQVAREDKMRNWVNAGQAKFGELLRQHSDNIEKLGSHVITNLVEYLDASQGALFVVKGEGEEIHLELLSAYAYKRKKFLEKKLEIGEGLAGQSYAEGKTIYLTDIKTDHYDIQTGLGESKPSSILIVPLKEEDRIEGIIEIASLKTLEKHQIEFVESIGASLASSLSVGKINQTTKKLLEETQDKAEQMRAQEEELRQNMEELAATQEQMERRNVELQEIQEKLYEEKYLLNALLNSTHDRIYFKDRESKFIRVSQSMIDLFEKTDESEILGKSDFDFGFGDHAKIAYDDEQKIIRTEKALIDAVEKEKWDDGHMTWVSTTKIPLRDLEGKVVGTFGISRDITSSKVTEVEMKKRKEWFENFFAFHPAGFVVLDQFGKLSFATKSILKRVKKDSFEDLTFSDIFAEKSFDTLLTEINFENVKDKETDISLAFKGKGKSKIDFIAVSGGTESEDGMQNIFLIQK